MAKVFVWKDKKGENEVVKGVTRTVLAKGEKLEIFLYDKEPGVVSPEHSHEHELIGLLIKGRQKAILNGEEVTIEPGMAYYIPGGELHGPFTTIGSEHSITLDIVSPPRNIEWRSGKKIE